MQDPCFQERLCGKEVFIFKDIFYSGGRFKVKKSWPRFPRR
jgi:hypothetical protein